MQDQKKVFCLKFNEEKPALSQAPFAGVCGKIILENISEEAFNEWLEVQIKIINEERLDLSEISAKERLFKAMTLFLNLNDLLTV